MKKFLKILLSVIGIVLACVILFFAWLSVTEFKPEPVQDAELIVAGDNQQVYTGREYKVISWNTGYAGLGKYSDFFMDGGTEVAAADKAMVNEYLNGICATIEDSGPDILMLQEVDSDSTRTYGIDERTFYSRYVSCEAYALNHSCGFVPYPVPPMGKINAGLYTGTMDMYISRAERISLPCPFSWPVSMANLKRCLLVSYLPIEGSDSQLVLVNLHLEAYDDGEGKIAQTNQLREFLLSEYEKGNYVIAAGDFNQVFPGTTEKYPLTHPELWEPGVFPAELLPETWTVSYDDSVPSCRLLNQPYDPSDTENTCYYVIDGVITSPNISLLSFSTLDKGFENSDHNPVLFSFKLQQ